MKRFLFVWIVMLSQGLWAQETHWLQEVQNNHNLYVQEEGFSFIQIKVVQSEEFPELSDVMSEMAFAHGLLGLSVMPIVSKDPAAEVYNNLTSHWDPYFCSVFVGYDSMSPNPEADCLKNLKQLFGDSISQADSLFIIDSYGDYYGDWREVRVVLQDMDSAKSLVLSFDIVHEI